MKSIIIFLTFSTLMILPGLSLPTNAQSSESGRVEPSINVNEAFTLTSNGAIMIDVREAKELEEISYKVENILHIPLGTLEDNLSSIPKDRQVILVCRSGNRSQKAYDFLNAKGYTNISQMEGGILAWEEADLPVSRVEKVNEEKIKKGCCADPGSKNCNPDGTCKKSAETKGKPCCGTPEGTNNQKAKVCCSKM